MKCVECNRESCFEVPDYFCNYHWKLWFYAGVFDDMTLEEFEENEPADEERYWFNLIQTGERVKSEKAKNHCVCS